MSNQNVYLLHGSEKGNILMHDLLDRLFRQKRAIAWALAVWSALIGLYLLLAPPTYEAEIQFLIHNNRAAAVISSEFNNGPVPRDYVDEAMVATEIQLLSNQDLLRGVVRASHLADADDDVSVEKTLKKFRKELKVSPVLKANIIKATYSSSHPQEVQTVLANLADEYLNEHIRAHSSQGAFDVFDKQAGVYEAKLKELQTRLTAFHSSRDIVALAPQKDLNLRKLLELEAAAKETEAARVANGKKIATLRSQLAQLKPRITTQARVVPNQYSVERLNTMLVELNNRRTDLLAKFQPQDRMVQEVEKQIADTKAALDRSSVLAATEETTDVNPLRQSLEAELAKAEVTDTETRAHVASLQQEIAGYRQALSGLTQATTTNDQLLREIKDAEDNFFLYSKKREEARIEQAMDRQRIANVALVQPPVLPTLPLPKLSLTVIAAWVLGCLLIGGCAFARGLARVSVYTSWELEGITGLPVLANVPQHAFSTRARALIAASILELEHE